MVPDSGVNRADSVPVIGRLKRSEFIAALCSSVSMIETEQVEIATE